MIELRLILVVISILLNSALGQVSESQFSLALPEHKGQLRWSAPGFKIVQSSAKPNGNEIGIRGRDEVRRITFLGFLFLVSEPPPLTSAKCRDGALKLDKKENSTLKVLELAEDARTGNPPVALVSYTTQDRSGKMVYMRRGFVASGDICGDLEFYSDTPISSGDAGKDIFASYHLDEGYIPKTNDVFLYAQLLYNSHAYKAAAPMFEIALQKLRENPEGNAKTMTRVLTDQAGMAYGIAGDVPKARAIFEKAITEDPDYPLYYYNLACADAAEKNLPRARSDLQKAFSMKANTLPGEKLPDPTKDDSFLPYRTNKEFWSFLESLRSNP